MIQNWVDPFDMKTIDNDNYDLLPDTTFELTFSAVNETS